MRGQDEADRGFAAPVAASENLVPQVSNRRNTCTLRMGVYDAEYLLFTVPIRNDERNSVASALRQGTFGVVAAEASVALARRGNDTALNQPVLDRL